MQLKVHGRNVEVTEWVQEYVEKKIRKLERHLPQVKEARAELTHSPTRAAEDRFTAQLTLWAGGQIMRSEESTSDIFASIDATIDKMATQIERFKGRHYEKRRRDSAVVNLGMDMTAEAVAEQAAAEEPEAGHILRHKQFVVQAMNEEEALEQMELLGHSFYVYFNPEAKAVNVVYKRKDGNYGVLLPTLA